MFKLLLLVGVLIVGLVIGLVNICDFDVTGLVITDWRSNGLISSCFSSSLFVSPFSLSNRENDIKIY